MISIFSNDNAIAFSAEKHSVIIILEIPVPVVNIVFWQGSRQDTVDLVYSGEWNLTNRRKDSPLDERELFFQGESKHLGPMRQFFQYQILNNLSKFHKNRKKCFLIENIKRIWNKLKNIEINLIHIEMQISMK